MEKLRPDIYQIGNPFIGRNLFQLSVGRPGPSDGSVSQFRLDGDDGQLVLVHRTDNLSEGSQIVEVNLT